MKYFTLAPSIRKFMLTVHIIASVGWFGALVVFLTHALASLISQDEQIVRATSLVMGLTTWLVILPLSLASLITGLVQALGTAWGLFRHYWILFKLLLTSVATIVLLLKLETISYLADISTKMAFSIADSIGLRISLIVHAVGGLLVLLMATILAVYKPRGMTGYGVRKQRDPGMDPGSEAATSTPLWVKVFAVIIIILILLVGIMMLSGGHGPGDHISFND
jgi:hypothetical protein